MEQARGFFLLLLGLTILVAWLVFEPFLAPLVLAAFTATLVMPLQRRLRRHMPERLAATLIVLGVFLIIAAPIGVLGYFLFQDVQQARDALADQDIQERFREAGRPYVSGNESEENATLDRVWDRISGEVRERLEGAARKAPTFLVDLLLGTGVLVFATFFLVKDADRLVAYIKDVAPMPESRTGFLLHHANQTVHGVFFGEIVTGIVQGLIGGMGFWIVGIDGLMLWTLAMAILSVLPIVGAFLVWIPAAIYLGVTGQVWESIFIVFWGLVPVSLTDNFLRPILIAGRTGLHPLLMFVAVLGGVEAFGAVGLILGPLVVGVLVALLRVWKKKEKDHPVTG